MTPPSTPKRPKILFIGWDGADWDHINPLLEQGLMPTLQSVLDRGVRGNLATLQPVLSPMLWNSVATGKHAYKHGVHGFIEPDTVNGGARPYTSTSRKTKAIWNMLTQEGLRTNVIGWWASHPAEPINGTVVTNGFNTVKFDPEKGWKISTGTIHPPEKTRPLARMRVQPNELTHEHIMTFLPNAGKINQEEDQRRLEMFTKVLADCASTQAVTTAIMAQEPWDMTAVYFDTVDHMGHAFMMYHPPKMPHVSDEDFEIYKDVMVSTYRFHDMMLARKLELAGPDATVVICSDHGFKSGASRPIGTPREPAGPAIWHRQYGIFVAAGPGICQNKTIYGASLIDMCPTLLAMMDLPIGQDMDGRPLLEIFEDQITPEMIPSWDDRPGESGEHTEDTQLDKNQSEELLQQFAALGYIENPGDDKEKQAESAEVEAKYNLARNYAWARQPDKAIELMEEILVLRPWEDRFIGQLANFYFVAGYFAQAKKLIEATHDLEASQNASIHLLYGKVMFALGESELGLKSLAVALRHNPNQPGLHTHLGEVYTQLRRWDEAIEAFETALRVDDETARTYMGLSTVYRKTGKNQETADNAMKAIDLLHRQPMAHFNLGVALARAGDIDRAIVAIETAIQFTPNMVNAHRWLIRLLRGRHDDAAKLSFHKQVLGEIQSKKRPDRQRQQKRRDKLFELPEFPPIAERTEILIKERPDPEKKQKPSGKTFVLVSGLPRSGTSLMMQMLETGGLPAKTDGEREADVDNPRGYYEWEAIKQVAKKPELLDEEGLEQKTIKVITMLLKDMPKHHKYKAVFMMRPVEEVVASQSKMIDHRGTDGAEMDLDQLARGLDSHRKEVIQKMTQAPNFELLLVDYPSLISDPEAIAASIRDFIGESLLPNAKAMASAIDPTLYRNRQPAENPAGGD